MNLYPLSEIQTVQARVSPLERLIWQALAHGEQCAHDVFADWNEKRPETELFNNIVRNRARMYLKEHANALLDCVVERVNNNGIGIIFAGCHSKLLKAVRGHIPASARTRARRAFLSQVVQLPLFPGLTNGEDVLSQEDTNLVFLWDHDSRHHIDHLWLVKPLSATRAKVIVEWQVELIHPLQSMAGQIAAAVQEVTYEDLEDEIQLLDVEEGETGTGQ